MNFNFLNSWVWIIVLIWNRYSGIRIYIMVIFYVSRKDMIYYFFCFNIYDNLGRKIWFFIEYIWKVLDGIRIL